MVDVATADDTPYSFEKEDRIEEERRGCRDGLGVANGPDQMADWAAFLLILPFFFLETPSSFLAAFCREKKRRVWKDLQTGYKT
jgi:hypothetical protein